MDYVMQFENIQTFIREFNFEDRYLPQRIGFALIEGLVIGLVASNILPSLLIVTIHQFAIPIIQHLATKKMGWKPSSKVKHIANVFSATISIMMLRRLSIIANLGTAILFLKTAYFQLTILPKQNQIDDQEVMKSNDREVMKSDDQEAMRLNEIKNIDDWCNQLFQAMGTTPDKLPPPESENDLKFEVEVREELKKIQGSVEEVTFIRTSILQMMQYPHNVKKPISSTSALRLLKISVKKINEKDSFELKQSFLFGICEVIKQSTSFWKGYDGYWIGKIINELDDEITDPNKSPWFHYDFTMQKRESIVQNAKEATKGTNNDCTLFGLLLNIEAKR